MRRFWLALAVFVGLVALELTLLAFVDTTTRPLDRAGKPFQLRNIATGTLITQRLWVAANGFEEVQLDGSITAGSRPATLNAALVEVDLDGKTHGEVRRATVELAASATTCCGIRFQPIPDSRWRAYRLDLTVGDLGGRQLSLKAAPSPVNGLLTINGRPQVAFLVFKTTAAEGTGLGRLRRAPTGQVFLLTALALMCNAAVAAAVHLLLTASGPRPA